jgi:hypothetical protein
MHRRRYAFRGLILVALASLVVAGCGSASGSSADPNTLLNQTFSGTHKVTSGVLSVNLTIDPSGSSVLSGPITISFGGPFQTRGAGKLPESNFVVSGSAMGRSASVGILSTGTKGYVTLQGTSYQLPQATFQKLESSFSQLSSTPGASTGSGSLAKLGIHPLKWLTHPAVVGAENVGGAPTTHIHAGVNVDALLTDLNTFLEKASSTGVSGASSLKSGLPPATRSKIAASVKNPSVDIWTGTNDKTVRRVTIALTVPVTGKTSSELGGVKSADIGLTLQYANLNQPQTITAPTTVRPFSEFQTKVSGFLQTLEGATGGALGSGTSSGGGTSPSTGTSANVQKYSKCIQQAAGDVGKMQKCASLLSSGG